MRPTAARPGGARRAALALAPVLALFLGVGSVATAAPGPAATASIGVLIHGTCVEGRDHQGGGTVEVIQKRGGNTIATQSFATFSTAWNRCEFKPILAGDQLVVKETVSDAVVSDRTVTIPVLTVNLTAATDVESGHAPNPGSLVGPGVDQMVGGLQGYSAVKGANTDSNGDFSVSWAGLVDIRAGDVARLFWYDPEGDTFVLTNATPSLSVEVGKPGIAVTGPYGPTTTARLRTAAGVLRGTATGKVAGTHSELKATFRKAGKAVRVRVGDRVTSSQIRGSYRVRASDLVVKKAGNGSLTATCAPGSDYAIFLNGVWTGGGMADPGGKVSSTNVTRSSGPIFAGSSVRLACRLPSGFAQVFSVTVR